jgi:hypothetical protein
MSLVTTQADMPALTTGDLQGIGSAVVAGNTERSCLSAAKRVPAAVGRLLQEREVAFDPREG